MTPPAMPVASASSERISPQSNHHRKPPAISAAPETQIDDPQVGQCRRTVQRPFFGMHSDDSSVFPHSRQA
jgi:hypothetical protein